MAHMLVLSAKISTLRDFCDIPEKLHNIIECFYLRIKILPEIKFRGVFQQRTFLIESFLTVLVYYRFNQRRVFGA